ncbi:MAG: hypothetical protein ACE5JF_00455 [Anaerolineales bacterium]
MPATKAELAIGNPTLSWKQIKGWISQNAWGLLQFAKEGFSEKGRGLVILAGSRRYVDSEPAVKCRYIMPEEVADIDNEALDLAHQLVRKYDPENEFVVVGIDDTSHVTSALIAVSPPDSEFIH